MLSNCKNQQKKLTSSQNRYKELQQLVTLAEQTLLTANNNYAQYNNLFESSQKTWQEFENLSKQVSEQIQQAKLLDQQLLKGQTELDELDLQVKSTSERIQNSTTNFDNLREKLLILQQQKQQLLDWKKENAHIVQLSKQPRNTQLLEKIIESNSDIDSEQAQEKDIEEQLKFIEPKLEEAQNNLLETASVRAAAERAASAAAEAELLVTQNTTESDRDNARQIISQSSAEVKSLLKRIEQNAIRTKAQTKLEKELIHIEENYKKTSRKLKKALKDTELAQERLDETQNEWLRIETLRALAKHIGLLKTNEPCPLCGSTLHPSPISEADKIDIQSQHQQRQLLQETLNLATKRANEAEINRKNYLCPTRYSQAPTRRTQQKS